MRYWIVRIRNFIHERKRVILLAIIVFLLMTLSYAMGYLMARDTRQVPIVIQKYSK